MIETVIVPVFTATILVASALVALYRLPRERVKAESARRRRDARRRVS